jgi:hypothetical protein
VGGEKTPPVYVLDREACLGCGKDPGLIKPVLKSKSILYTPSCVRKVIRKLDSGDVWNRLEAIGIRCYEEGPDFFVMCGSLRDAANALSASRANFEEEKLHIIAVARMLNCPIISGDKSTSSSSMREISVRFAVTLIPI